MAKLQTHYLCQSCGIESAKWMGKCPECGSWDSFVEEVSLKEKSGAAKSSGSTRAAMPQGGAPVPITSVEMRPMPRIVTGISEFDRVLGGGIVPGALMLVGGDPGIGKSTLLTQVAAKLATAVTGTREPLRVLYISGEESAQQIRMRSGRLNAEAPDLFLSVETEVSLVLRQLESNAPAFAIVDSIQTMFDSSLESAPGSISQVRACAHQFARFAKTAGLPIVLIGHVTKDGTIAGPRVLEHMVDTVLSFEGDRHHAFRLLRAIKNRFGSTDELGIFEMRETGLEGVENPSAVLLSERAAGGYGSAVTSALEGSRALLVETQALVAKSSLASPRRTVTGLDPGRVNMILAVLEKRAGMRLAEQDAYLNVAGGMKVVEPAADLAAAVAVASNFREEAVHPTTIVLGEIGLAGEVRAVSQTEKRLREAGRQGFSRAVVSRNGVDRLPASLGMELIPVDNVQQAISAALHKNRS
jgi:DNA repair protein RadA/Sms